MSKQEENPSKICQVITETPAVTTIYWCVLPVTPTVIPHYRHSDDDNESKVRFGYKFQPEEPLQN